MHYFFTGLIGMLMVVLVACGDAPTSSTATVTSVPQSSAGDTAQATPEVTGTVRINAPIVQQGAGEGEPEPTSEPTSAPSDEPTNAGASVLDVAVSGDAGSYQFSVTVASPDTGCEQYADWWEVLDTDGNLLYRRVLLHSHIDEQPFTRSGGPVEVAADTPLIVRAHMNNLGYGTRVMQGTAADGFERTDVAPDFAADVETQAPLPEACAF